MLEEVLNISLPVTQIATIEFSDTVPVTDDKLVQAVIEGDERAFAELFDRYKRSIALVVGKFFRERADIEECVQVCFTKAYFSLNKYKGGEERSFSSWLTRIAVNVCYDEFRRRKRKAEDLFTEISSDEADYLESLADGRRPSDEKRLVATQLAERILGGLDPKDRIALTLVYSEDYSLGDVAEAMGISSSNLKSRLFRCRNKIKMKFGHLFR